MGRTINCIIVIVLMLVSVIWRLQTCATAEEIEPYELMFKFEELVQNSEIHSCEEYDYVLDKEKNAIIIHYHVPSEELFCLDIPDKLDGYTVVAVGDGVFQNCNSLFRVKIPATVTHLCRSSFIRCESLIEVVFSDGLLSIGPNAFDGCSALRTLLLPETLQVIGPSAFFLCSGLEEIYIPESVRYIGTDAFMQCERLYHVCYAGSEEEWEVYSESGPSYYFENSGFGKIKRDFLYNVSREEMQFQETFRWQNYLYILDGNDNASIKVFQGDIGNTGLKLLIPSELNGHPVVEIGDAAFWNHWAKEVIIPDGIVRIGRYAFRDNFNLETVSLPNTIVSVGDYAFFSCENLKTIVFPSGSGVR